MFCRPVVLCLLNGVTDTIQVTEGCMWASPVLGSTGTCRQFKSHGELLLLKKVH
jgi:hypothetical protein